MKLDPMQIAGGFVVGGIVGWMLGKRQTVAPAGILQNIGHVITSAPSPISLSESKIVRWMETNGITCETWLATPEDKLSNAYKYALQQGLAADAAQPYINYIISAIDLHCGAGLGYAYLPSYTEASPYGRRRSSFSNPPVLPYTPREASPYDGRRQTAYGIPYIPTGTAEASPYDRRR